MYLYLHQVLSVVAAAAAAVATTTTTNIDKHQQQHNNNNNINNNNLIYKVPHAHNFRVENDRWMVRRHSLQAKI